MTRMRRALVLLLALTACTTANVQQDDVAAVNHVVDDWHRAAAEANESRYFGHMTTDSVFLGTDATERWDLAAFRAFAAPYFKRGRAWTFVPKSRHVMISPRGDTAWFDEALDSANYGECRGTGVLRKEGGVWKIAHYNLTIPIPNDLAAGFVEKIRAKSGTPPAPTPPQPR